MDSTNDILELLDILYGMVNEAWGVPLGNDKCIIEREKAISIIDEIKANLPSSISESKRLVAARDEFIGNAKREAESLRKNAEESARQLVDQQEIVRVARERANGMISTAEAKSAELRRVAEEYVDEMMRKAEQSLDEALSTVRRTQLAFRGQGTDSVQPQSAKTSAPKQEKAPAVEPQEDDFVEYAPIEAPGPGDIPLDF